MDGTLWQKSDCGDAGAPYKALCAMLLSLLLLLVACVASQRPLPGQRANPGVQWSKVIPGGPTELKARSTITVHLLEDDRIPDIMACQVRQTITFFFFFFLFC